LKDQNKFSVARKLYDPIVHDYSNSILSRAISLVISQRGQKIDLSVEVYERLKVVENFKQSICDNDHKLFGL